MISAAKSKAYRRFIKQRDEALERLYMGAQGRVTQALAEALQRIYDGIAARHLFTPGTEQMTVAGDYMAKSVGQLIDFEFSTAQLRIAEAIMRLRKYAGILTRASETEALRRAGVNTTPRSPNTSAPLDYPMPTGGTIEARVALALNRIKNKILDALQLSRVMGEDTAQALDRVKKVFPKIKRVAKPKKLLVPVAAREADAPKDPFKVGFIDEDTWDQIVSEYLKPYQPRIRDPRMYFDVTGEEGLAHLGIGEGVWMGWEIEQQITSDFVDTVRKGQHTAAKEQGISDFVWITVFGPTTCESCKWRNGLTSSEIEAKLEDVDDEFDATVPPAHPSCRCQLAPMVEELGDEPGELGDFSTWLT